MIDRLYVARGDRTSGPFSSAELRGLATAGRLRPTDTVWREGAIDKAVDAAKVKNLFPSPQTLAPAESAGAQAPCAATPPPADACRAPIAAPQIPLDSPSVQPASVPPALPVLLGAGAATSEAQAVPKEKAPRPPPDAIRKRRAVAVKGAVILSQDGVTVHYRKKCIQCGFEDRSRSSMPIGNGTSRIHFYCPECRKGRDVQILGIMQ